MIRKEELSIFNYIRDIVLSNYIILEEGVPLVYNHRLSSNTSFVYELGISTKPAPYDIGRGFTYFDDPNDMDSVGYSPCDLYPLVSGTVYGSDEVVLGTPEQSNRIKVYDEDRELISDYNYLVDYVDCRIVTSGTVNPAFIDYSWNYVSLLDDWEKMTTVETPIVVVNLSNSNKKGYQLGGGSRVVRNLVLYVFCNNSIEKKEITDVLYDGFYNKTVPIYKYPLGTVLDYDGTWYGRKINKNKLTSLFDRTTASFSIGNMFFEDIVAKDIEIGAVNRAENVFLSKVNKFRSRIEMKAIYYT